MDKDTSSFVPPPETQEGSTHKPKLHSKNCSVNYVNSLVGIIEIKSGSCKSLYCKDIGNKQKRWKAQHLVSESGQEPGGKLQLMSHPRGHLVRGHSPRTIIARLLTSTTMATATRFSMLSLQLDLQHATTKTASTILTFLPHFPWVQRLKLEHFPGGIEREDGSIWHPWWTAKSCLPPRLKLHQFCSV